MAPRVPITERRLGNAALVLCAHGIRGGVGGAADHAGRIAARGLFAEVHACALKGAPGLNEIVAAAHARELVFVPLLMAEGYTLDAMLQKLEATTDRPARVTVCRPIGVHPRLADGIATRARALCAARAWRPGDTALLIVGHGTERHPESDATARRHAAEIAARGIFAEVATGFLDERPLVPQALCALRAPQCVAIGLFVDAGEHGEEDIPALLAPAGDRAAYAGPIGPDPLVTELILDQAYAALKASIAAGISPEDFIVALQ
jgi:sirohydrochlorin cobaltochelatase